MLFPAEFSLLNFLSGLKSEILRKGLLAIRLPSSSLFVLSLFLIKKMAVCLSGHCLLPGVCLKRTKSLCFLLSQESSRQLSGAAGEFRWELPPSPLEALKFSQCGAMH